MKHTITTILCLSLLVGCTTRVELTQAVVQSVGTATLRAGVVTVAISGENRGSGFVIAASKSVYYVGTVAHVVGMGMDVEIDGQTAQVVQVDHEADLALLTVLRGRRHYLVLLQGTARVGKRCRALGFHFVSGTGPQFMVLVGHVATLNYRGYVGANSGLHPGNSGGPLVNDAGGVIGINHAIPYVWGSLHESMSMFVRSNRLYAMLKENYNGN